MAKHNTAKLKGQLGDTNFDFLVSAGRICVDPLHGHLTWTQSAPSSWKKVEREVWATRGIIHGNQADLDASKRAYAANI